MEEHMNNARQIHLDLMCSLAYKQQDTIKKLNEQIEKSTTSYNGVLVWKIKVSIKSNYASPFRIHIFLSKFAAIVRSSDAMIHLLHLLTTI